MSFVPGICPQCGGKIEINNEKDAAICEYCGMPFIVEKAINTYKVQNMTVESAIINNGPSALNLAARGKQFEEVKDYGKALEYYNKSLDLDVNCVEANEGIKRIETIKKNTIINSLFDKGQILEHEEQWDEALDVYLEILRHDSENPKAKNAIARIEQYFEYHVFYESDAKCKKASGRLYLKRHELVFEGKKKGTCVYEVSKIEDIIAIENMMYSGETFGRTKPNCVQFNYLFGLGDMQRVQYKTHGADELVQMIRNFNGEDNDCEEVEEYIKKNFAGSTVPAIAYYREKTGVDLRTAKEAVIKLFEE